MRHDRVNPEFAIEAHGLVKDFDGQRAVDGIDVAVAAGTIYGVLGPNGAGKTTTLRMLLGIIDPDEGHRTLLGHSACGLPRWPARSAIHPMSPCAPLASHSPSRAALSGAASACVIPQATKPSASA